jgi:hypothetical protein
MPRKREERAVTETEARERALQVFRQHNRSVGSLDLHTDEVDLSPCEDSEPMRSYRSVRGEGRCCSSR